METSFGRYKATTKMVQGAYSNEIAMNEDFQKARALSNKFAELEGRRLVSWSLSSDKMDMIGVQK